MKRPSLQKHLECLTLCLSLIMLAGCANNFEKFYTNTLPEDALRNCLPHTGEAQYYSATSTDMRADIDTLLRKGYMPLGNAAFNADAKDYTSDLHEQAEDLQADVVLLSTSAAGARSGVIPLMTYTPGQTSTTYVSGQVHANAYGSGGYASGNANYSGTATTTSSGTYNTNYIPYSVERSTYEAIFFRKYHRIFGVIYRPLDDSERRELQRNTGLVARITVEGTPAFTANILPGDILLTLDGETIGSEEWFSGQLKQKAGEKIMIGILRNGAEKQIELRLNANLPAIPAAKPIET